ncbi:hypothetical protein K438DRAFT_1802602 [Mycena galopus ATCC 62051]|nr:hypothetical protein K438DRAFT_1802602 [Mycena galopus ATCC 62051]
MSASLRRRLETLDAQITEQRRVLDELQQTRSDVERELYATATFPVLTLPTEITTEIFSCCLSAFDPLSLPKCKGSAPIVLTGICRQWRDIALATSILWSKLNVEFDDIRAEMASEPGLVEGIIDRGLTRARKSPLSLELNSCSDEQPFALSRLRDIIHRWSHRVRYLHLEIGTRYLDPLRLGSTPFPLLQSAALGYNDDEPEDDTAYFGDAPRFHALHLLSDIATYGTFTLPWSQLTKFEGKITNLRVFVLAPNLTEMTCDYDPVPDSVDDELRPTTHHNLRSLDMRNDRSIVLENLTLPALQNLVIHSGACVSLESLFRRSSAPLLSLSVHGDAESYLEHLRQSMPLVAGTLESLEFLGVSGKHMRRIFRLLNPDPEAYTYPPLLLPNIRTLGVRDLHGLFNLDDLIWFLCDRSDKLQTFTLVWRDGLFLDSTITASSNLPGNGVRDTVRGHLSRLAQAGMNIYLGTAEKNYLAMGM